MKRVVSLLLSLALVLSLAGCTSGTDTTQAATDAATEAQETAAETEAVSAGMTAGTYTASAMGMNDEVTVEVEVSENEILSVTVTEESETPGIGGPLKNADGEILAGAEFYTYDDKYKNGVSETLIPARLSEEKLDEVKDYAAKAYTAVGCEGLARCDFFVERGTGRVMINEINTFPGFTSISMYPKLMEHEGTPLPQLIDRLVALAMERAVAHHG